MKMFRSLFCAVIFLLGSIGAVLWSQEPSKPLPPGLMTTIPPRVEFDEVANRADVTELLATLPKPEAVLKDDILYRKEAWAQGVRFRRPIWCFEFSFKPLRIVAVDIPNKEGMMEKKLVWYLVYEIKNTDASLADEESGEVRFPLNEQPEYKIRNEPTTFQPVQKLGMPMQFVPQFILSSDHVVMQTTTKLDPETAKIESDVQTKSVIYVDQVIPLALPVIMRREGFSQDKMPETTVSIAKRELKPGESAWGVAMWTGIDPKISKFSIYVSGLTNAYRWQDKPVGEEGAYKPGEMLGTGRRMERRVLKLNWWHLGDAFSISDREIKFGQPGEVDYEWVYR